MTGALLTGGATTGGSSTATGAVTTGGIGAAEAGFSGTAGGIVETTGGRGGAVIAGRGGAGGCCCCISFSRKSLSTSPGLEILERSSFGLISAGADLSREDAELDLLIKYFRIFSASSTSTELEWVFFSVMPTSNNISRIALLFTSSSRARSLIRIFVIRSAFPPIYFRLSDHNDLTVSLRFTCKKIIRPVFGLALVPLVPPLRLA